MFERFTESSIKSVMLAQEEARRMGHNYVGTEQLLLGIIAEEHNIAAKILNKLGANLKSTRNTVKSIIGLGSGFVAIEIPFTPKAKNTLENSLKISNEFGSTSICPEYLLLGLLDVKDCVALKILEIQNVNTIQLRSEIISQLFKKKEANNNSSNNWLSSSKTEKQNSIETRIKAIEEQMKIHTNNKTNEVTNNHCEFIGHGRNKIWARVNSFLIDEMSIPTEYFERNSQTGKSVIAALESYLEKSTFAVIIMTAEDDTIDGEQRARQNVIHEIGLFQGRLGFEKVAILLQEGVEQFSNIAGLQYIPFSADNIEQTFYQLEKMLIRENIIEKRSPVRNLNSD